MEPPKASRLRWLDAPWLILIILLHITYDTVLLIELAMTKQTALKSNLICGTKAVYTVPV